MSSANMSDDHSSQPLLEADEDTSEANGDRGHRRDKSSPDVELLQDGMEDDSDQFSSYGDEDQFGTSAAENYNNSPSKNQSPWRACKTAWKITKPWYKSWVIWTIVTIVALVVVLAVTLALVLTLPSSTNLNLPPLGEILKGQFIPPIWNYVVRPNFKAPETGESSSHSFLIYNFERASLLGPDGEVTTLDLVGSTIGFVSQSSLTENTVALETYVSDEADNNLGLEIDLVRMIEVSDPDIDIIEGVLDQVSVSPNKKISTNGTHIKGEGWTIGELEKGVCRGTVECMDEHSMVYHGNSYMFPLTYFYGDGSLFGEDQIAYLQYDGSEIPNMTLDNFLPVEQTQHTQTLEFPYAKANSQLPRYSIRFILPGDEPTELLTPPLQDDYREIFVGAVPDRFLGEVPGFLDEHDPRYAYSRLYIHWRNSQSTQHIIESCEVKMGFSGLENDGEVNCNPIYKFITDSSSWILFNNTEFLPISEFRSHISDVSGLQNYVGIIAAPVASSDFLQLVLVGNSPDESYPLTDWKDFGVVNIRGVDVNGNLYIVSTRNGPTNFTVESVRLTGEGSGITALFNPIFSGGAHNITVAPFGNQILHAYNGPGIPQLKRYQITDDLEYIDTLKLTDFDEQIAKYDVPISEVITISRTSKSNFSYIYARLTTPPNVDKFGKETRYPAIVTVQSRVGTRIVTNEYKSGDWLWAAAVAGFVVIEADVSGASGYGISYTTQVKGHGVELQSFDIMDVIDWARSQPWSNGNIILYTSEESCLAGAYALANIDGQREQSAIAASIFTSPIADFRMHRRDFAEPFMGIFSENGEDYEKYSLGHFVSNIRPNSKILIVHGSGARYAQFQQGVEFAHQLIEARIPFESMWYPNEDTIEMRSQHLNIPYTYSMQQLIRYCCHVLNMDYPFQQ